MHTDIDLELDYYVRRRKRRIACTDQSIVERYDVDCHVQRVIRPMNAFNALSRLDMCLIDDDKGRNKCVKCVADRRGRHRACKKTDTTEKVIDIDNIIIIRSIGHTKKCVTVYVCI